MSIEQAMKKIKKSDGDNLEHYLSSFATDLLLTQAISYDGNGNTEYVGYALPGTSKAAPLWLIKRLTYDGSQRVTDIQFANGVIQFDMVWNDRTSGSITYS